LKWQPIAGFVRLLVLPFDACDESTRRDESQSGNDTAWKGGFEPMSPGVDVAQPTAHAWLLATLESQQRLIHKVCWAYTRTPQDRDDLFQDIAVRLLSAHRNYDPSRKLSTWVYRVALNVAIDFHRQRRRQPNVSLAPDEQAQSAAPEVDERLDELHELLQQQTEVDRALLLLYLDGNSHREIGDVLGISESNVGTKMNRLKNKLRQSVSLNAH
jgi:RNA polymerase sigma factor (sigma-70 family)